MARLNNATEIEGSAKYNNNTIGHKQDYRYFSDGLDLSECGLVFFTLHSHLCLAFTFCNILFPFINMGGLVSQGQSYVFCSPPP